MSDIETSGPRLQPHAGRRALTRLGRRSLGGLLHRFETLVCDVADPRADPVETAHQLRVTSRRTDVALRLFRDWLPRRRRTWMRQTLKLVRRDAGAVRDMDLLGLKWALPDGELAVRVAEETAEWMHALICEQRSQARRRLLEWTRKSAKGRLRKRSHALVRGVRRRDAGTIDSVRSVVNRLLGQLRDSLPAASTSPACAHRTRIYARRVRYALELLRELLPGDIAASCESLGAVQDQLGRINDEETAIGHLKNAIEACCEMLPTEGPAAAAPSAGCRMKFVADLEVLLAELEAEANRRLQSWDGGPLVRLLIPDLPQSNGV